MCKRENMDIIEREREHTHERERERKNVYG